MKRLLVSACLAGLAISGAPAGVMAAETASASTETGATAAAKPSRAKTAAIKPGQPAKTKIPLPVAKPTEAEEADASGTEGAAEPQADATPAETQRSEAPAADATPDAAEQKTVEAKPSYMRTGHPEIDALVATHARANNVPEALVHRVIVRESKYQKDLVGSCGCIGLMQIKLATARGLGYGGDAKGLHDPNTNLTYGVKYLAGAYRAASGDHDRAVHYFAKGYYEVAKRQRLADAQPLPKRERAHAPLDITPKQIARASGSRHAMSHAVEASAQ
jgi:soluble lytic murein transglycosylase-like protein